MGHIPEEENFEEYMNASAEEWSKPSKPEPQPDLEDVHTDRWGSPISDKATINDGDRWGSEPIEKARRDARQKDKPYTPVEKKSGTKWWIIAIVIVVVLCLCVCLTIAGLSIAGINLFESMPQF